MNCVHDSYILYIPYIGVCLNQGLKNVEGSRNPLSAPCVEPTGGLMLTSMLILTLFKFIFCLKFNNWMPTNIDLARNHGLKA